MNIERPDQRPLAPSRESSAAAAPTVVDFIYDTVCPWCFIGKRRLDAALRTRPDRNIVLRCWPFLLNPAMPAEGMDRIAYLSRKFGSVARVTSVQNSVAEVGRAVGIAFDFDRMRTMPSSRDSHRLILLAERHGLADRALETLFAAFFANGQDIGQRDTLIKLGVAIGLDGALVADHLASEADFDTIEQMNRQAHRLGMDGVPAFRMNERFLISGAQDSGVLTRLIDVAQTSLDG